MPPAAKKQSLLPTKTVLHVGCGGESVFDTESYGGAVRQYLAPADWTEIRVDMNTAVSPDVVADASDLPFDDGSADALVCLACLEHMPEWVAGKALCEFNRVLRTQGQLILQVPDLSYAAKLIVEDKLCEVIYESPAGPVRALDMIYGHQLMTPSNPLMRHCTGWTSTTFACWLYELGFDGRIVRRDSDLWAYTTKYKDLERESNGYHFYQPQSAADGESIDDHILR